MLADPDFEPVAFAVSRAWLGKTGLGKAFIEYMARRDGVVREAEPNVQTI